MKPKTAILYSYGAIIPNFEDENKNNGEFENEEEQIRLLIQRQKKCICVATTVIILFLCVSVMSLFFVDLKSIFISSNKSLLQLLFNTNILKNDMNMKPNFIIILADDLSWNSIGYSSDDIAFATPYLTALAQKGIIMSNFYAQEVCTPSRASLLTGKYPLSLGMQYGMIAATAEWGMPLDEVTIAEVLKDNSYTTHMLGKWHLGYFSPLFLPTARGFDTWTGYSNGENYYWSKRSPDYPLHSDFLESNKTCYTPYSGSDKHDYSTTFYTNKAINIIQNHNTNLPLFMYLAYQAVHDPFVDHAKFENGIPDSYFDEEPTILQSIYKTIVGKTRQEYVKSLYLLDKSVGKIMDKLTEKGIIDNTYIIFMSDNGGCWYGGGRNGPLRGSKGALFEGGIKVDSFIYSSKLSNTGTVYSGLMHISDWFPTILALADIDYTPSSENNKFDGVNQVDGWMGKSTPRTTMLYNLYLELTDYTFNIWTNGSFAIRDNKYKLMHTYDDPAYGGWYQTDTEILDDDVLDKDDRCAQQFLTGKFTYWLFDLIDDPYETTNLYSSDNQLHKLAKANLYTLIPGYMERAQKKIGIVFSEKAETVWQNAGNNIIPWANTDSLKNGENGEYPVLCM